MGWVVSSTSRPYFTPGKDPVPILQGAGWAPGPVWTGGKSRHHRDSIPDRPARSQSLYRLSYRGPTQYVCVSMNSSWKVKSSVESSWEYLTDTCHRCSYVIWHKKIRLTLRLITTNLHPPPPLWRCGPTRAMASSFLKFLDHTQRRTIVGRTPLNEWSETSTWQ